MATTLAQLLADAQKRKFTQLVSFIQDIDDKLTLKQIDAVIILDQRNNRLPKTTHCISKWVTASITKQTAIL